MIIVVSSNARETAALGALLRELPRPIKCCASVHEFRAGLRKTSPSVVLTRARLNDGYSDDVIAALSTSGLLPQTPLIVLAMADLGSSDEARQISLGADCVFRDPLRPGVLVEYLGKFFRTGRSMQSAPPMDSDFTFAGVRIIPSEGALRLKNRVAHLTPKEIELARLLSQSPGRTISYEFLYSELFNRSFSGDSANLRVLLGRLVASYRKLNIDLRERIRVTPKSGYCYVVAGENSKL